MKKTKYLQCSLRRKNCYTVSWIPQKFAKVGLVLKLKNEDGEWVNGWIVESVGDSILEEAPDTKIAIKKHRQNTGDSLPKEPSRQE